MSWLSPVTAVTSFFFSLFALWLGFYIVTRDPHGRTAWLSAITMWGLSWYLANVMVFSQNLPIESFGGGWWGIGLIIIVPTYNHMTHSIIQHEVPSWQRWVTPGLYVLAAILIVLEVATPWIHIEVNKPLLTHADFRIGPLYPVYLLSLSATSLIALYNLYYGYRQERRLLLRRQYQYLIVAALLAILSGLYGGVIILGLHAPFLVTVLGLGGSILSIGLGVSRFNALVRGRLTGRELNYTALAIGLVVLLLASVSWISTQLFGTSFSTYVFVIMAAVASHSLYDWARTYLDRLFFRNHYGQIRLDVREIIRNAYTEEGIENRIQVVLHSFCQSLQATGGSVVLMGDSYHQIAWWRMQIDPDEIGHAFLASGAPMELTDVLTTTRDFRQGSFAEIRLAAPLFIDNEKMGVVLLGDKLSGREYVEEEISLIDEFCDSVATLIRIERIEKERIIQVNQLLDEMKAMEDAIHLETRHALDTSDDMRLVASSRHQFIELVADALRNFHDITHLGEHRLSQLRIVEAAINNQTGAPVTGLDRGRALQKVLMAAIEKLRPQSEQTTPAARDWYQYAILHGCYVEDRLNRDVMAELYVSESTFHRSRRKAVRGVGHALYDMELNALE